MKYLILGITATLVIGLLGFFISVYNYGNTMENKVAASYENLDNVLSQYSLKVQEVAQIPTMYKDDLKEVFTAAIEGRYGENGSQAVFQWIQEQNPNFDSSLYKNIQQIIDAGRTEFRNEQTQFIELKRQYKTALGTLITGSVLKFAGYPKTDLEKYKIISTEQTKREFESGIGSPLKVR